MIKMTKRKINEKKFYSTIIKYLEDNGYVCKSIKRNRKWFKFTDKGINQFRLDAFGIKIPKSKYSREAELAAVEVKPRYKRASKNFMHQALRNSSIAHRCFLAMPQKFTEKEIKQAAEFGIGLLQIKNNVVELISQSSKFLPDNELLTQFLFKNHVVTCSICGSHKYKYDVDPSIRTAGGGWRNDIFSKGEKWVYFCNECRKKFETPLTERKINYLVSEVEKMKDYVKTLKRELRKSSKKITGYDWLKKKYLEKRARIIIKKEYSDNYKKLLERIKKLQKQH